MEVLHGIASVQVVYGLAFCGRGLEFKFWSDRILLGLQMGCHNFNSYTQVLYLWASINLYTFRRNTVAYMYNKRFNLWVLKFEANKVDFVKAKWVTLYPFFLTCVKQCSPWKWLPSLLFI